jgi:peroxiredoxin Q/BCP
MVREGERAPEFELQSDRGDTVRLEDFRGRRIVLYFYPKDDTSGCTKEACGFRDAMPELEDLDTVVLGVSPDDVGSHAKFRSKYDLNFPLLADPEHEVASAYGVWGKKKMYGRKYEGILRTTFVIGPDGQVEKVFENVKPAEHAEEILQALGD